MLNVHLSYFFLYINSADTVTGVGVTLDTIHWASILGPGQSIQVRLDNQWEHGT